MTDVVIVLTTVHTADADRIAWALVEERLAACVNVFPPMSSMFRWRGEVLTETEQQLVVKTVRGHVPRIRERLAGMHPYELPEFLVLEVAEGGDAYLAWVRESTGSQSSD